MEKVKNAGIIQEWMSLINISQQIKSKIRKSKLSLNLNATCIDFNESHIVLGTDCGIIYWCPRSGGKPQEVKTQKHGVPVTSIKIGATTKSVHWVATGDKSGSIHVFKFSSLDPSEDKLYYLEKHHKTAITALEWNHTGQVLFSGDELGIVKTSEMSADKKLLVGNVQIINEQFKIVQISFTSPNLLLVSTVQRTVIIQDVMRENYVIQQIGKKERRSPISLGGVITMFEGNPVLYVARPKQKIWVADLNGTVSKTLIYSDLIAGPHPRIKIINSAVKVNNDLDLSALELNRIDTILNKFLVVSHQHGIIILDPISISVVASLNGLIDLKGVAVHADEIMFVEGNLNLVRLGWAPDGFKIYSADDSDLKFYVGEALSDISDISIRLKDKALSFVPLLTATFNSFQETEKSCVEEVCEADEAFELPPVVSVDCVPTLTVDTSPPVPISSAHSATSDQTPESENIVYAQTRIRKKKLSKVNQNSGKNSGVDSGSDSVSTASAISELTSDGESSRHPSFSKFISDENSDQPKNACTNNGSSIPSNIESDLEVKKLQIINADEKTKEKMLEEALNIDGIISAMTKIESSVAISNKNEDSSFKHLKSPILENKFVSLMNPCVPGPSNDNSSSNYKPTEEAVPSLTNNKFSLSEELSGWKCLKTPENLQWFSVSEKCILIGGKKLDIYYADLNETCSEWKKLDFKASRVFSNLEGSIIWKLNINIALELENCDIFNDSWQFVSRNVSSIALSNSMAWYICDDKLYVRDALRPMAATNLTLHIPCNFRLLSVSCYKLDIWVLCQNKKVLRRTGIDENCLFGSAWADVLYPPNIEVLNIAIGPNHSGWIVAYSDVYFTKNYLADIPHWFQLLTVNPVRYARDAHICFNNNALWIADCNSDCLYTNSHELEGEKWVQWSDKKWKFMSAEGSFDGYRSLWVLSDTGRLYQTYSHSDSLSVIEEVELPNESEVLSFAVLPYLLWILMANGEIYIRDEISEDCYSGTRWRLFDLQQIGETVMLQHLSISINAIWAVSNIGKVFMTVDSPYYDPDTPLRRAWVKVESDLRIAKVFVGPPLHMVWAIDIFKNIYVRDAIFHDFQVGLSWILVPGLKAKHLSLCCAGVWAISVDNKVFFRQGITENNYIGDYWHQHTGLLSSISASGSDDVWGLDTNNYIVVRRVERMSMTDQSERTFQDNCIDENWEVIGRNSSS